MLKKSIGSLFFIGAIVSTYGQKKESDTISKDKTIDEVVMVGTRVAPRTNVSSPLPIDAIDSSVLQSSGQTSIGGALQYRMPSFNSTSAAVQDATSLLDPFEIRNMGSSRTLVLINGKRKNTSSLMFIQNTVGKGETGADLSAIPNIAIKKVEILRDGASAQYGSDAIAGVMNIILKDKISFSEVNTSLSMYTAGDGFSQNLSAISGATFENGGFFTIGTSILNNDYAKRSGNVNAYWEADTFGASLSEVQAYLAKYPDANNKNVLPKKTTANIVLNTSIPMSDNSKIYANASYVSKNVNSYANHRTPYWKPSGPNNPLAPIANDPNYIGFSPTFEGDLTDYSSTLGFMKKTNSGWNIDLSGTFGGNKILFTVQNTYNPDLGANSPINFKPGGYRFNHFVGNMDFNKRFSDLFSIAFGSEIRREEFEVYAGDEESYQGGGAISFPGMDKRNAGIFNRYNMGAYIDTSFDLSDATLINATARMENYSDFGNAFVWKMSFRQKLDGEKLVFRASASTGFKAPSLHQLNLAINQASFSGGQINVEGILSNNSKEARQIGIPKLTPEKSMNYTVGFGFQPNKDFSLTLDGYLINIKDRVLLSSRMAGLVQGVSAASFFINGIDTRTMGIDLVASYKNIDLGSGKLAVNLAGNMNNSKITNMSDKIKGLNLPNPFNRMEEAIATTSRPAMKAVLGFDYVIGQFAFNLNNTYFGKAKWVNDGLPNGDPYKAWDVTGEDALTYLEYQPKVITDLNIIYNLSKKSALNLNIGNLLNVIPNWKLVNVKDADAKVDGSVYNAVTFNGRYPQSAYDSQHFSIFGTQLTLGYSMKF